MLCECKGDCTLTNYYHNELKAAPSVLKYIINGKLVLASKDGGVHIKSSKYTVVFTGRDGSHCTGVAVCVGRGTVCQKLTLGIPTRGEPYVSLYLWKSAKAELSKKGIKGGMTEVQSSVREPPFSFPICPT